MDAAAVSVSAAPQHIRALKAANEVRLARAALKRSIAAGERDAGEVLLDCPWMARTMSVGEFLASQRQWGHVRSQRLLRNAGIPETKLLETLTERQRVVIAALLTSAPASTQAATQA